MGTRDELDEFFAHCPAMLFTADPSGMLQKLSQPLARLLGPEAGEGTKLSAHVHPDDLHAFEAAWTNVGATPEPVPFEFRLREAQGSYRIVSCTAGRSAASGDVKGWIQAASGEAEAHSTQAMQATFLRAIQDHIPLTISAFDPQGVYFYMEGKGLERVNLKPGQFVGMSTYKVFPHAENIRRMDRALAGECMHSFSEFIGTSWESWIIPMRDERGELTAVLSVAFELSEAKRAERELVEKLALIERQREVIQALSTPIIEVWDKVLTLPMVGVVDSTRAADVMESLLEEVSRKGARFAILDLTGLDAVDTGTASHLLKMVQALRLLGAEGIITGIRPTVAQTMVALGMDLESMVTLSNLRDGLRHCMKRLREEREATKGG